MSNRRRLLPVLAVLSVAVVATLAACSSSDDDADATTTTAEGSSTTAASGSDGTVYTASGPIQLAVGERATIELEANATTGYQWDLMADPDATVVKVVSDTYVAPDDAMPGQGGSQRVVIEGAGAGTATITLGYARPWEEGTPPAETANFDVTVS